MYIHHLNFLVQDLDTSIEQFERILGQPVQHRDRLAQRGALTARFRLGRSWLVLVQPTDPDGVPGRHLREHGEGFFLCSLGVDDLESAVARLAAAGVATSSQPRQGLDNWRVQDLDIEASGGIQLQLTEDPDARD